MVSKKQSSSKKKTLPTKKISAKITKEKPQRQLKTSKIEAIIKETKPSELISEKLPQNIKNEERKKVKYIMPSKFISDELVEKCLQAVEKVAVASDKKNTIFNEELQIFIEINCIKIQNSKGNIKFVLPHSTAASTGEVCLITPDLKKGKKPDHEPTIDHWEELLRNANITAVKTILPMRQLRVEYDQFELKRRLMTQHDFILVDTRVLNHVSHLLGKRFFKKHNMLIPIRLDDKGDLKKQIDAGLRTVMLRLNEGATSTIVVGHTGMPRNKLKENVIALVKQLRDKYPGGDANIRSLALKLPLSMSVPLYVTLRSSNTVTPPKIVQKKPKQFAVLEDELSTILGSTVRVAPDGTVQLKKSMNLNENFRSSEVNSSDETEEEQEKSEEESE